MLSLSPIPSLSSLVPRPPRPLRPRRGVRAACASRAAPAVPSHLSPLSCLSPLCTVPLPAVAHPHPGRGRLPPAVDREPQPPRVRPVADVLQRAAPQHPRREGAQAIHHIRQLRPHAPPLPQARSGGLPGGDGLYLPGR